MKQEIEIEFKNMVTKDEFETLCNAFSITNFSEQTNHYFETTDFALKAKGSALRIRFKNNMYTLTLKQPAKTGLLETHQSLTEEEAKHMINTGKVLPGSVAKQLQDLNIPLDLSYFGSLTTNRAETMYKDGLLVFDHSFYFNHDDYELEYEVKEESKKADFLSLLAAYNIPVRLTQNKVQRFFLAKQSKGL
jgi:uncharacterized protein YjbK